MFYARMETNHLCLASLQCQRNRAKIKTKRCVTLIGKNSLFAIIFLSFYFSSSSSSFIKKKITYIFFFFFVVVAFKAIECEKKKKKNFNKNNKTNKLSGKSPSSGHKMTLKQQ